MRTTHQKRAGKKRFYTILDIVASLFLVVAFYVRPLMFLIWFGVPLALASIHLYYRELEKEGKVVLTAS